MKDNGRRKEAISEIVWLRRLTGHYSLWSQEKLKYVQRKNK